MTFHNPDFDPDRFAEDMRKKAAARSYGILFTPRSGSSWLTDVLDSSNMLGRPKEWFNPNFVPDITRALNARSLDDYLAMLRRKQKRGGYFAFEATIFHIRAIFGSERVFLAHFPPADVPFFYLIREDIVAQAVSLAKAVGTGVFHSVQQGAEEVERRETNFAYDADQIAHWLDHIHRQERECEALFRAEGLAPHRMSYEQIMADGATATARRFLVALKRRHRAEALEPLPESAHTKIGTGRNADYAARFRRERAAHVAAVEADRSPLPTQMG